MHRRIKRFLFVTSFSFLFAVSAIFWYITIVLVDWFDGDTFSPTLDRYRDWRHFEDNRFICDEFENCYPANK